MSEAAAIYAGLKALTENLLSRAWKTEQGVEMRIDRCLIDSGWNTDTIYQFCRQCAFAGVIYPSKGYGIGAAKVPISEWPIKPGERSGYAWRLSAPESGRGRTVKIDVNLWKSFIRERLATPEGSPGCLMLCGSQPHEHQLFADHLTSEYRTITEGRGRRVEEWNVKPTNTENHWWDCVVGCAVAASITGLKWLAGDGEKSKVEKKRKSLRDVYEQAKEHAR
jgi:phage terminase large subunit GpA-like protein